ncbi:N-6 DNA methylase [uncultured Anaeromusa sp.]|uniref:restriction endonuclease subunit M n=1 Tax=uncultured Anaeromusa sp. TaxID=673273 RepID=UPI0029C61102|nr:N-6 DNA methylase [uncultured Anaeromusa sp.]
MEHQNLIELAKQKKIITISEDNSTITYIYQNISRNYNNPEEKVQAKTFCELVLKYNYPVGHIKQYVKVTVGSDSKEADIIVYNDSEHKKPHIIIECKKGEITEQEFKQAVRQAYAYAFATAGTTKYIWVTSGIKDEYYAVDKEVDSREAVTDIPNYKVEKLASYKFAKNGGTTGEGQRLAPLVTVEESELTNRFKQAHQALWGGGELNPSEAFDELDKLIFCKIFDEKKKRKNGDPYDFQIIKVNPKSKDKYDIEKADRETSENLLKRLIALYDEGKLIGERKNDTEIFREGIKLNASKARTVVSYLEGVDLLNTDLDSKGRAFETFMGSFFRGDFGQYFTPRNIVSFIVDSLPIDENDRVLDTSCGSGGFLLHALDKVRKAARDFYNIKDGEKENLECHKQWHDFAEYNLYGIEINEQISRTAKMNMIIHDDGHTNVVTADGLLSPSDLRKKVKNDGFKENSFHYIITNPPFGSTVKQTEKAYLHQYNLAIKEIDWLNPNSKIAERPSQSTEVLFIEQAEKYLIDGGYLAIVIPDGILTNSSMQYVRDYISDTFRIIAVISMPQTAFSANGAGVKSSVMFLKKYSQTEKKVRIELRNNIQNHLISKLEEGVKLFKLLKDKKDSIAKLNKEIKQAEREKNIEKSELLNNKKQELTEDFDEQIEFAKETLSESYLDQYKKTLTDYPIFMAIAEDIGYDATGKETGKNELLEISVELSNFIKAMEEGKDHFF